MIETISGVSVAVATAILSRLLSKYFTEKLIATTILVGIAFIYVGFALKDNPVNLIIVEVAVAIFLYFLAIIGYNRNSLLIAYGIMLHGLWDIFHHGVFIIRTDIPGYWPSFCFIVDIIDGLYFLIAFKKEKQHQCIVSTP